ncbi:hypothetical protein ACN42_g10245 [Penicillium freii]|uniref:Carboxylic ester hydrolase n=1 Tax=Penicillium freii TaxID=48697 RepID=A0A101MAJ1_PENFR|nr:hypothetical protein ACN42_g10245 [Penicillium freii]
MLASAAATTISLTDICTTAYTKKALPVDAIQGVTVDPFSISTSLVTNFTATNIFYPTSTFDYCNVTFAYSHDGIDGDIVHVQYWLPAPGQFKNRYVSTGGGGWAINSGSSSIPTGVIVGGVGGLTDGGFGSFATQFSSVALLENGTINWQATYMFGYQAQHELALLGKELTRNIYNVPSSEKIYSYYQGCSEGGREKWSQVQRFPDQFDGIVAGAPAFRWAQQQTNHLTGNVIQKTLDYYSPSCELEKIMNMTVASCDLLDGKTDGIVSRSDLCLKHLNWDSILDASYSCPAVSGSSYAGATPAQTGKVSAKAIEVIKAFWNGLHDSDGKRVYFNYQPGSTFDDLQSAYDSATDSWGLDISGLGGMWIGLFIDLLQETNIPSLDGVTYDTLKEWMILSQNKYGDIFQTTYPDLSDFQAAGGKVIHVHGEQDYSISTASSVRYWDSVREIMFPNESYSAGAAAVDDFYRLFLIPGVGHCGTNEYQPNAPWPQTTLQTLIDWVENGKAPATLAGSSEIEKMCRWPLRPLWTANGSKFQCVYDQESIDSFSYNLDAYKLPVY